MKKFIDRIVTEQAEKARIARLKRLGDLPVILYGGGFYARELTSFLASIEVHVSDYMVDDEYAKKLSTKEIKPCGIADIAARYSAINLFLAYCGNPDKAVDKLNSMSWRTLPNIQIVDCRFWERFSPLTLEHVHAEKECYQRVFEWFQDDLSRETYTEYINAKLLYDSSDLRKLKCDKQYFPGDLWQFLPSDSDVFIDAGAFTGDTLDDVLAMTAGAGCKKYYAFEPDIQNVEKLRDAVQNQNLDFVEVVAKGLWKIPTSLCFSSSDGSRSAIHTGGDGMIDVDTIDRYQVPATFIKMDIEGAEYEALLGASETIRRNRPNLSIALYHKPEDLLQIPVYIKSLCPDYRFFLRIHSWYSEELVLYATVRNENPA